MDADEAPSSGAPRRTHAHPRLQRIRECVAIVGLWFPVVFVVGLTIYAYYVYVVEYCVLTLLEYDPPLVVRAVLYLIFMNVAVILLMANFLATTFRDPGSPTAYKLESAGSSDNLVGWRDDAANSKPVFVLPAGTDRYCGICDTPKPERCHHCSVCQRCRLKMDHHCPWFNNCIGYHNYKFFLLTLFWTLLLAVFIFATLLQELIWELANDKTKGDSIQFLIICIVSFVMGVSSIVLFIYHMCLVGMNMTTLEHLDRSDARRSSHDVVPPHHIYDVGFKRNFVQVFGRNPLGWLLPVPVDECQMGLYFPKRTSERVEEV